MRKFHIFTSLDQEEKWINVIQAEGYQLVSVNPWFASYHFEKCSSKPNFVRLDFHEHISRSNYMDYLNLFHDSGWRVIKGSKRNGVHYFQQLVSSSETEIFSDKESRLAFYQRYQTFASTYFAVFITLFIIYYQTGMQQGFYPWQP